MMDFFFFNDTATTEIYTLSLHDALPISVKNGRDSTPTRACPRTPSAYTRMIAAVAAVSADRKSTRLNSSHANISYAVFCLKKKKHHHRQPLPASAFYRRHGADRLLHLFS